MAKVSIIIPTYNVEMFLDECLESIQRQTLQDIEIICVNDGSTDHSLEIIKKYAENDPRFVIVDKENGGYECRSGQSYGRIYRYCGTG